MIPYLSLHEFEALLYSDPSELARYCGEPGAEEKLRSHIRIAGEPEKVNDGAETHPSKRISDCLQGFTKRIDGPAVAARIGLWAIRAKCPHFNHWLSRLEDL